MGRNILLTRQKGTDHVVGLFASVACELDSHADVILLHGKNSLEADMKFSTCGLIVDQCTRIDVALFQVLELMNLASPLTLAFLLALSSPVQGATIVDLNELSVRASHDVFRLQGIPVGKPGIPIEVTLSHTNKLRVLHQGGRRWNGSCSFNPL